MRCLMSRLDRLLRPRSVAVIGGGPWCNSVIAQCQAMGFDGPIWPVHPHAAMVAGLGAFPGVEDLPHVPDAVFVGVNRHATIEIVRALSAMGAGGAVCFASGFSEAVREDKGAQDLQARLVRAAGEMPILGPNCYGFINALDGALLWPDQHGCARVPRGVAILTQSSNIAINLSMQQRALPIAYTVACGNMAQTGQAKIAMALLDDSRVSAIGLHVEGFGALAEWEALAARAHDLGVPLVVLKVGVSPHAQAATVSHTASLAGSDAGAQALLDRLGIPRLRTLPDFLETLKLLHLYGPLDGMNLASISCSGGEASLIADMSMDTGLQFPPLSVEREQVLRDALGPMVALGNPLDYNTYIWRDTDAMARAWAGMTGVGIDMTVSIVDYPVTDSSDWRCATDAALKVRADTQRPFGVVSTLPELMPRDVALELMAGGVIPFFGLGEALAAIAAAGVIRAPHALPLCQPGAQEAHTVLTESVAKAELSRFGVKVPQSCTASCCVIADLAADLRAPLVVKGVGLAHKTEAGAVRLGLLHDDVAKAAAEVGTAVVLVEEMVSDGVAELLIGVIRDPAHGFVLTLGAGGVLAEVLRDTASRLLPVSGDDIRVALDGLAIAPVLRGFRGQSPADTEAIIDAVLGVQAFVMAHAQTVSEVEINPLICTAHSAIAVDALIRIAKGPTVGCAQSVESPPNPLTRLEGDI